MSEKFVCSVLEFPFPANRTADTPDPVPNWDAAQEYILEMSDLNLAKVINDTKEYGLNDRQVDEDSFIWDVCSKFYSSEDLDISDALDAMRGELLFSIEKCQSMWEGNEVYAKSICLHSSMILICGESSEGLSGIDMFESSGAASVAGFINVQTKRL